MNYETAKEIELAIAKHFNYLNHVIVPNVSWGFLDYEADLLILTKSNYAYEVEIKVSKNDLIRDKQKSHKHNSRKIRKLWFAVPEKLKDCLEHIPEKAGVIIVQPNGYVKEHRKPVINTAARKLTDDEMFQVARLGSIRVWSMKQRMQNMQDQKE